MTTAIRGHYPDELLAWISTMLLIAIMPVLFCELIVYVIDQVLRRLKDDET